MAQQRGLAVDVPYSLQLSGGNSLIVEVRLRNYGAEKGMLIVSEYSILQARTEEIIKMGYGYSCMSQPSEDKIKSDEGLDDILNDWKFK